MGKRSDHYHVYVVELAPHVWDVASFRRANPDYALGKPFFYVGMTGLDPDIRFDRHKAGVQANRFARDFGLKLRPDLYERFNPMNYQLAKRMEVEIAIELRESGCGVWQA